ncbi:hypothetical protein AWB73_03607 [Caballeronia turbans]|nr:hypothetical protein AWB73_03607 [Caballeronia turbans]
MPLPAAKCARPASGLAWRAYSANFSCASRCVRPTTTVMPMMIFRSPGARPAATACARSASTSLRVPSLLWLDTNTHSACRTANAWPRPDDPAWNSTGVRCGEGSQR